MHIVLLGGKDLLLSPLKRSPMTSRRYALRDDQWQRIEHLLPGKSGIIAVTTEDKRLFRGSSIPLSCGHSPGVIYQTLWRLSGNSLSQHVLEHAWRLAVGL